MRFRSPISGFLKAVAPPRPGTRPAGLPPRPGVPRDVLAIAPDGPPASVQQMLAQEELDLRRDLHGTLLQQATRDKARIGELESQLQTLQVQNGRLLANAAAALERVQVAERDPGGAVEEAETILASVVRLDGTYVQKEHVHEWRSPDGFTIGKLVCDHPGCDATTTRVALVAGGSPVNAALDLRTRVHRALSNAVENGYPIALSPDEEIASDLRDFDADLEDVATGLLVPHVRAWRQR